MLTAAQFSSCGLKTHFPDHILNFSKSDKVRRVSTKLRIKDTDRYRKVEEFNNI